MSRTHSSVQITVTGHKFEDRECLLFHVQPMFATLFALSFKVQLRPREDTMMLYIYSKRVAKTLHEWGMPFGYKKLSRLVPSVALDEVSFVRGLFDTDGCVYRKYGPYMQIQFKSASHSLQRYVRACLLRLGFHPTTITSDESKFRFFLGRQAEVSRFFQVIEPKNAKHQKRFRKRSSPQLFRSYKHRSESEAKSTEPTKAYRNSPATPRSVGQPSEPFALGAVV